MGKGDNRLTRKVRKKRAQQKKKEKLQSKIAEKNG